MERFFGGNPGLVLIRLAIISFIVGILLSILGLNPADIIRSFQNLVERLYDMGFDAVIRLFRYFLLGAVLVIPIWLIARIFKVLGRSNSKSLDKAGRSEF